MLWIILPAYNEEKNLKNLLPELGAFLDGKIDDYKILIIDDGSVDSTKKLPQYFEEPLPLEIISHEINKGVGEVFKTAFAAVGRAAGEKDFVIVMEADGTSDYTLIPNIIRELQNGNDIVIASRYIKGGAYKNFPLKRHLISLAGNMVLRFLLGNKKIKDYTIFYRGYKASLIKKALARYRERLITSKTFLANTEMLHNFTKLTDRITEIPFIYSYDRKIGKSKMPIIKTLFDYLGFLFVVKLKNK
ncbi:MAG: glycosyltransferase [Candidatus Omnitrophica bacterium]|nr:glycosyltransferase [Candidatus Omnitrophota bacterium]